MKAKLLIGLLVIGLFFGIINESFGSGGGGGGGGYSPPVADLHVYRDIEGGYYTPPILLSGEQAVLYCVGCYAPSGSGYLTELCFDVIFNSSEGFSSDSCPYYNGAPWNYHFWTPNDCGDFNAAVSVKSSVGLYGYDVAPYEVVPPAPALTSPSNNSQCTTSVTLQWSSVSDVDSYMVYFGTTDNPPFYLGNIETNSLTISDSCSLQVSQTYYWEVKSVKNGKSSYYNNSIWHFTVTAPATFTISGKVKYGDSNLADVNMSGLPGTFTDINGFYTATVDSNWSGTVTPLKAGYTFDPNSKTYSNVNSNLTDQNYTANLALPGQASNFSPDANATNVSINADISWAAGSYATSHDMYFGTTNPPTFQKNQTLTTFDPGTMKYHTIYYYDINERNAGGVTAGNIISFTTEDDSVPPDPNPMGWDVPPHLTGPHSISMTAQAAFDLSGVKYDFNCTSDPYLSKTQTNRTYEVNGLTELHQYTFKVRALDNWTTPNPTGFSSVVPVTIPDSTPPTPNPMTWASVPTDNSNTSISMAATVATDVCGVEYYFSEISGNPGSSDSGWQDQNSYTNTGLVPGYQYTYIVRARDKSPNHNATQWSVAASARTTDNNAPSPNPMTWAVLPYAAGPNSISMMATVAFDPAGGIKYDFNCPNEAGPDSNWIDSPIYQANDLNELVQYGYRVKAKDANGNETGWSAIEYASTLNINPPAAPAGLFATATVGAINLRWNNNSEADLGSYGIYRSEVSGGPYQLIERGIDSNSFSDTSFPYGVDCFYVVTAVDTSLNESGYSNQASAVVSGRVHNATKNTWYDSIQEAINGARWGDKIEAGGNTTYKENLVFNNRKIILTGADAMTTIIDGNNSGTCMTFGSDSASSEISKFTIRNGRASNGGGIYCQGSSPKISNCIITDNNATSNGGGMYALSCNPVIINCNFNDNNATQGGGGIYESQSSGSVITNCTLTGNRAPDGGALYSYGQAGSESSLTVANCIFWNNGSSDINNSAHSTLKLSYCDVNQSKINNSGTINLIGVNINANPQFVNPSSGNYRLGLNSPCINAGDPNYLAGVNERDLDANNRVLGGCIDIGAYEKGKIIYTNADANTGDNGISWATAFKYLQDAFADANAGDEIWVAGGTYKPDDGNGRTNNNKNYTFQLKEKVAVYGGFDGNETMLDKRNWTLNKTILSGDLDDTNPDGERSYHVVKGANGALLDGFVVTAGYANQSSSDSNGGGGMLNFSVSDTVRNCTFYDNDASTNKFGGGMYNRKADVKLVNCLFTGNRTDANLSSSQDGFGGAVYNQDSNCALINCTVAANLAKHTGGIYDVNSNITLTNCILWKNQDSNDPNGTTSPTQIASGTPVINYSCITGWTGGGTNIGSDPCFVSSGHWDAAAAPDSILLEATVRDFVAGCNGNDCTETPPSGYNRHPDFQYNVTDYPVVMGIVGSLGASIGDDNKPDYNNSTSHTSTHNEPNFNMWYNDTPWYNLKTTKLLELKNSGNGIYTFRDPQFFPIDGELFGSHHTGDGGLHNFHFTLELHTKFTYHANQEYFRIYMSDDDLFIYIDRKLVIDLGGIHSPKARYLSFEDGDANFYDVNTTTGEPNALIGHINLNLQSGHTYNFDLFFAERHTTQSHLEFSTTMDVNTNFTPGNYHLRAGSLCIDAGDNNAVPPNVNKDLDCNQRFFDDPCTGDTGRGTKPIVDMGAYEYQINVAPDADNDQYTISTGQNLEVAAPGVLANDTDKNGDALEAQLVTEPSHGTLTLNEDGSFSYSPAAGFSGVDSFTYDANDGTSVSNEATVTITVNSSPVNVVVNAGADKTLTLPQNIVVLSDSNVGGGNPPLNIQWSVASGGLPPTGTVDFNVSTEVCEPNSSQLHPTIKLGVDQSFFSKYNDAKFALRLSADDNNTEAYDDIIITLKPEKLVNIHVQPGGPYTIGVNEWLTFDASVDYEGLIGRGISYRWTPVRVPVYEQITGEIIFDSVLGANVEDAKVKFTQPGNYLLNFSASCEAAYDEAIAEVEVTGQINHCPQVSAGGDFTTYSDVPFVLNLNELTPQPYARDIDGDTLSTTWSVIGPVGATFRPDRSGVSREVTFEKPGTYILTLTVSDGQCTVSDDVIITVAPKPEVEAGANKYIVVSETSVNVPLSDAWAREYVPPFGNMTKLWTLTTQPVDATVNFNEQANEVNPTITISGASIDAILGKYRLDLTVTDPGAGFSTDTVYITIVTGSPQLTQSKCRALYAGVSNSDGTGDVYRRLPNNSSWERLSAPGTFDGPVVTLCEYHGEIYAGTKASEYVIPKVMKWSDKIKWQDVSTDHWGGPLCNPFVRDATCNFYCRSGQISALADFNDKLYAAVPASFVDGDTLFRYDGAGSTTWTKVSGVGSGDEMTCLYPWNDRLYLGFPYSWNGDVIGRYNGSAVENVMSYVPSLPPEVCPSGIIFDFEIYRDRIFASGHWGIYASYNGNNGDWSKVGSGVSYTMEVLNDKLYTGEGIQLSYFNGSDWTVQWQTETGVDEILSLKTIDGTLFIGTGKTEKFTPLCTACNQGRVYKLWFDGQGTNHLANFSEGIPDCVTGVQCLVEAAAACEPNKLRMRVTAYIKDKTDPAGWVPTSKSDKCVSQLDSDANEIKYEIIIMPNGQTDAQGLTLTALLPTGVDFVSADDPGAYDANSNTVIWLLDDIDQNAPQVTRNVIVRVNDNSLPGEAITTVYCLDNNDFQLITNDDTPKVCCWNTGVLYVNKNNVSGIHNGTSWDKAFVSVEQALDYISRSSSQPSEVWVSSGTYNGGLNCNWFGMPIASGLFQLPAGVAFYGGFAGTEDSLEQRNLKNPANATILDGCDNIDYVVIEANNARLDGFTIKGGYYGAIYCPNTSPTIANCVIQGHESLYPSDGVYCYGGSPIIANCIIENNTGNGIRCKGDCSPIIRGNKIHGNNFSGISYNGKKHPEITNNWIYHNNGAIELWWVGEQAIIRNNTITNNQTGQVGGIWKNDSTQPVPIIKNCIVFNNGSDASENLVGVGSNVSYCCVGGGYEQGQHIINVDPLFVVDNDACDYHLQSASPCINSGYPATVIDVNETDIDGGPRIIGSTIDIGAYEYPPVKIYAGTDKNGVISIETRTVAVDFNDAAMESIDSNISVQNLSVEWTLQSGQTNGINWNGQKNALNPTFSFSKSGLYILKLSAKERAVEKGSDTVYVWIDIGMSLLCVPGQVHLPDNTAVLTAGNFAGGEPNRIAWYGPDGLVEFVLAETNVTDDSASTTVTFTGWPGIYQLWAVALDSEGNLIGQQDIWVPITHQQLDVSVIAQPGIITLPENRVDLTGNVSGISPDNIEWVVKDVAKDFVTFGDEYNLLTWAKFSKAGIYEIALLVYDNYDAIVGADITEVTVNSYNYGRFVVNAGPDQTIDLPRNFVFLTGKVEGGAGLINKYEWVAPISSASQPLATFEPNNNELGVTAAFDPNPAPGDYVFTLLALYNDGSNDVIIGADTVTITVDGNGTHYSPPVEVNAGNYPDINLPASGSYTLILDGNVNDQQRIVASTEWVCHSDQNFITFDQPVDNLHPIVTFTAAGEYRIGLLAKNNDGNVVGADCAYVNVFDFNHQELGVNVSADSNVITITVDNDVNLTAQISGSGFDYTGWSEGTGTVQFSASHPAGEGRFTSTATFKYIGSYVLKFAVKRGGPNGTVVGWKTIQITVNPPQVTVTPKAKMTGESSWCSGKYSKAYMGSPIGINLTGEVSGANPALLTYQWTKSSDTTGSNLPDPAGDLNSIMTFYNSGLCYLTLTAYYNSVSIGAGTIELALLDNGRPIVDPGKDYNVIAPKDKMTLYKARIWDDKTIDMDGINWDVKNEIPETVNFSSRKVCNPDVSFTNEGIYTLTLSYTDNDLLSAISKDVNITVQNPSSYVSAGRDKWTVPFYSVKFDDAIVMYENAESPFSFNWGVTSGDVNKVVFLTSDSAYHPVISFEAVGTYKLLFSVYHGAEFVGDDELTVTVNSNPLADTTNPVIDRFTVSDPCYDGRRDIVVEAHDSHLDTIKLFLDGNDLHASNFQVLEGSITSPVKLKLTHILDTHSISDGVHVLKARAIDTSGNSTDSNSYNFTTDWIIHNFTVEPQTATDTNHVLHFSASLDGPGERNWQIYVNNSPSPVLSGTGNQIPDAEDSGDLNVINWENGSYEAVLHIEDENATVPFTIAKNLNIADLNATIDNKLKTVMNNDGVQTGTKYVIKEGFYDLNGIAYYPVLSDEVYYKIEIYQINVENYGGFESFNWKPYFLVANVTPGQVDQDGFARGSVGSANTYGSFGTLDFSTIPNGVYYMLLTVECRGLVKHDYVPFVLDCKLKIGNVKFSQEDFSIDVGGVPLRIVRSYDGFNRNKQGDFGYGWTLEMANMDIELNEDRDIYGYRFGDNFNRDVTLTLPNGNRATFRFDLEETGESGYNWYRWQAKYYSPEGETAQLTTDKLYYLSYIDSGEPTYFWAVNDTDDQTYYSIGAAPEMHDFSGFKLTTEDGTIYNIKRQGGNTSVTEYPDFEDTPKVEKYGQPKLDSIVFPTGDTINFKNNDVNYCQKDGTLLKKLTIVRDEENRISKIFAPGKDTNDSPDVIYEYDDYGNLSAVSKLIFKNDGSGNPKYETTTYVYDDGYYIPEDHYVTEVLDPRGLSPIRYVYDEIGRLIATIDAKDNYIEITHDTTSRTEEVNDRSGNITIYGYDNRGRVTFVLDANNGQTSYEYNDVNYADKYSRVITPDGNSTWYQYDSYGRTKKVTDPELNITQNTYDNRGNLTKVANFYNTQNLVSYTSNTYNSANMLIQADVNDANNVLRQRTRYVFNDSNQLTEVRQLDPCNLLSDIVTTYVYNQALSNSAVQPYSITSSEKTTYFRYNDKGEQIESREHYVDANNSGNNCKVYTETVYDEAGRVIETIREVNDVNGGISAYSLTLNSTIYNSIGKVDTSINELGLATEYDYDELGNIVETRTYDEVNDILTVSRTLYDVEGRVWVTVGPYEPNDANLPIGTENVYDCLGRVKETRKWADVNIAVEEFANGDNETVGKRSTGWTHSQALSYSRTEYDIAGRVHRVYAQNEDGQEYCSAEYVYDRAGKQIQVIDLPDDIQKRTVTTTNYKGILRDSVTDAANNTTSFIYDCLAKLTKTTYPTTTQNPVTYMHLKYDGLGRKTFESQQTSESNPNNAIGKTFGYDSSGRMTSVTLPEVADPENNNQVIHPVYQYDYDTYDNLVRITDPKNRQTTFTYDELNNQTSRKLPGGQVEYKSYDSLGRLIKATDFKGQVAGYFYNSLGRLQYEKYYDANTNYPNNPAYLTEYTYDNLGRRKIADVNGQKYYYYYDVEGRIILLVSPQGEIGYEYSSITGRQTFVRTPQDGSDTEIEYRYDDMGRLSNVVVHRRNGVDVNESFGYGYSTVGSLEWLCHPNGDCSTYSYDSLNRLIELTNEDSSNNVLSRFVYQLANNGRRQSVTEMFADQNTIISWGYDNLNRLTSETYDAPGTSNDYTQLYTYDLVGNRLKNVLNGTNTFYHYNANDQLLKETSDPAGTNILVQYQYNDNGSMTQKAITDGNTSNYTYNLQNKLESFTINSVTTAYAYNHEGKRVQKQVAGVQTTNYLIDPQNHTGYPQVFKETTGPSSISYVTGLEILSQNVGTNSPQYLLKDGHSSVRQIANSSGTVTGTYHFDAYGNLLSNSSTPDTNILYVGQMWDNQIGLYDNWNRWYDPANGLFTQSDTFTGFNEDPISLHKYLYANCNPIMNTDPTGEFSFSVGEIMSVQSLQKLFRVSHLSKAYKVYEAAENLRDGFQIVSQFWLTGTIDPVLMASLIANIGPFDEIIKGMKRAGNVYKGLSETLTGFYRKAVRELGPQKAAQVVGELSADFAARFHKLHPTDFPVRYHGIDRVYKKGNHYYILEAKGGTGQLDPPQMSQKWIKQKIENLRNLGTPEGKRWADTLDRARMEGQLSGMLVETRIPNEIVKDPVVTIKSWAEIGADSF